MWQHIEARDALSRALVTLSEEEREAVSLRYGADMTLPEIAKLTGEKLSTVQGRVYRALRKLGRRARVTGRHQALRVAGARTPPARTRADIHI